MRKSLGRQYLPGEVIIRQGEVGDCMYVVQDGEVEVLREENGAEVELAVLGAGECFGEMAVFEREVRSATVRARREARVLTVDKKTLLRRFQKDPSLALNILQTLSYRIRVLDKELADAKQQLARLVQRT